MILPKWPSCRLTDLSSGRLVRVTWVDGGSGMSRRLYEMGVRPGAIGEVLSSGRGPVIFKVDGTRLAMGRRMAKRVMVEAMDGAP